jgi:hypothetical protein
MSWKAGSWISMRFTDSNEEWIQIRIIAGPKKNIAYLVGGTHPKDMVRLQDLNHKGLKRQQPAKHRCIYIYIPHSCNSHCNLVNPIKTMA